MDQTDDPEYHARRELEERATAALAPDPAIAAIHLDLADRYAALIAHVRRRHPRLRLVTSG